MKLFTLGVVLCSLSTFSLADTLPFNLNIKGNTFDIDKTFELSDVGEGKNNINFDFKNKEGKKYSFDLKYKKLASNRSYPGNLDITLKDSNGKKLGYLFLANNGVQSLKKLGVFGLIIDINGAPVDIKFTFDDKKKGSLKVSELENERFVQDTLVPKFSFQMIRPVIIPSVKPGLRSITYNLDNHPFSVNYTLLDREQGGIEFQHNLYSRDGEKEHLLERIYFYADNLETLREAMYAGKYFHSTAGTFKLVFYPAMGQTEPPKE